jgi:hypothetical protein
MGVQYELMGRYQCPLRSAPAMTQLGLNRGEQTLIVLIPLAIAQAEEDPRRPPIVLTQLRDDSAAEEVEVITPHHSADTGGTLYLQARLPRRICRSVRPVEPKTL